MSSRKHSKQWDWKDVSGSIVTLILMLAGLKDLGILPPFQLPVSSQDLTVTILAVLAIAVFPLWVGYQVGSRRSRSQEFKPAKMPESELKVTILPSEPVSSDLWETNTFVKTNVVFKRQSLSVQSLNYSDNLAVNIWVGKEVGATHLGWKTPVIDVETYGAHIYQTEQWRAFLDGEIESLPVWYAYAGRERKSGASDGERLGEAMEAAKRNQPITETYQVFLNTMPIVRLLKPEDIDRGYIILTIQFAGIRLNEKIRKYRLNLRPWDEIGLEPLS